MNYGKLTAGTTKTAIDTAKPSEKGEIITYLSRMGDVLHNVAERGQLVLTLGGVHTVRYGHKADVVQREKLFRQLADLNIVAAQPGQVFDEHSGDIPRFGGLQHLLKVWPLHRRPGDPIVNKENIVRVALFPSDLLQ